MTCQPKEQYRQGRRGKTQVSLGRVVVPVYSPPLALFAMQEEQVPRVALGDHIYHIFEERNRSHGPTVTVSVILV